MPQATYNTKGTRELERALVQLGRSAGFKALTGALRDANRTHIKHARSIAPEKTGALKKSIKAVVYRGKGKSDSVATLQTGYDKDIAYWGQIIERGAVSHRIPNEFVGARRNKRKNDIAKKIPLHGKYFSNVTHPGHRPYKVLARSFDAKKTEMVRTLAARLRQRIILETIKKYGKAN